MAHFTQELKELAARSRDIEGLSVMSEAEKDGLRVDTEKMWKFCQEIKETTQVPPLIHSRLSSDPTCPTFLVSVLFFPLFLQNASFCPTFS